MRWPPSRATFLLLLASASAGYFLVGTIIGSSPDGAWLGFSAAIWAAWDNEIVQERRRRQRRARRSRHGYRPPDPIETQGEAQIEDEDEGDEDEKEDAREPL